jgi:hypothetical protein
VTEVPGSGLGLHADLAGDSRSVTMTVAWHLLEAAEVAAAERE